MDVDVGVGYAHCGVVMNSENRTKSVGKRIGKILGGILLGLCALVLFVVISSMMVSKAEDNQFGLRPEMDLSDTADWMASVDGSMKLNQLAIPGTHDAGTEHVQLAFFSRCQSDDIGKQLENGYRYLDIRLAVDSLNESKLKLMHGFCACLQDIHPWSGTVYLENVLAQCYQFLDEHPTETIVFCVKHEYGDETIEEFATCLNAYVQRDRDYWFLSNQIPTLDECRGKIVLARRYSDAAELGEEAGLAVRWLDQGDTQEVPCATKVSENILLTVQDRYCYEKEEKWDAFCTTVKEGWKQMEEFHAADEETPQEGILINFLSTKGQATFGHPYFYAHDLDQRLMDMDFTVEGNPGWVILDFGNAYMAKQIYQYNLK